jgi:lysophospholipase L1-like esterase
MLNTFMKKPKRCWLHKCTQILLATVSILLLLKPLTLEAQSSNAHSLAIQLEDGDTFVFIGNSITHQCLYTQYVENYFYTRYPDKRLYFHNAGVSGDLAADVNVRFEPDIEELQPKYASILIGMNDGRYMEFTHGIFNTYKEDMSVLLDKLDKSGIFPILITPTMFDLRAGLKVDNGLEPGFAKSIHYNATMAFFGAWLYQVATERGFGYVNMYEPLNRIIRENRHDNPEFTLIEDAVHPGPSGQLVMALAFLRDVGANPVVSSIHIDLQNEDWEIVETENGKLEKLHGDPIRFRFTSKSLPWVVPEEASLGFKLSSAGHLMSREIIRITGLDPGDYNMQIDGKIIGKYTHLQFSEGIALQGIKSTPQHQQAEKVAQLNKKRNDEAIRLMRNLWRVRKFIWKLNEAPEDFDDEGKKEEIRKYLVKELGSDDLDQFLEVFRKEIVPLKQKAKVLEDQIYELNRPVVHTYEIIKQ